ncbi:serine/threonine-protein kinase STY46 [Pelomyxa schiedti]|nr:serine/threonine-protein kinase STY46 [Pelomyxa schiedti]
MAATNTVEWTPSPPDNIDIKPPTPPMGESEPVSKSHTPHEEGRVRAESGTKRPNSHEKSKHRHKGSSGGEAKSSGTKHQSHKHKHHDKDRDKEKQTPATTSRDSDDSQPTPGTPTPPSVLSDKTCTRSSPSTSYQSQPEPRQQQQQQQQNQIGAENGSSLWAGSSSSSSSSSSSCASAAATMTSSSADCASTPPQSPDLACSHPKVHVPAVSNLNSRPPATLSPTEVTSIASVGSTASRQQLFLDSTVKIGIATVEELFGCFPALSGMLHSGQQRAHTSSGGVLSVTFTQPFPSTPKVLAWLFGYSNEAPFSAVPTSKILASSTGFTAAVEGNSEMCWIAFATPVTAPALKDAIRIIQASPRGLNKQLVEKVEASIKEGTINARADDGKTLLHVASYSGNSDLVSELLKKGPCLELKDNQDMTPLLAAISEGHFAVAEALIKMGAKLLPQTRRKQTALHFLAKSFKSDSLSTSLLRTLLCSKIDVNAQTDSGDTALMIACTAPNLHLDFISSLIFAEANPSIENNNGESPITKAKASGNIKLIDALSSYSGGTSMFMSGSMEGEDESTATTNSLSERVELSKQLLPLSPASPPCTVVALELVWNVFQKIGDSSNMFQSGKFTAQNCQHHIDFITPFRTPPHVSMWSLSGFQLRIPTKKIASTLTGFDVALEDSVPLGSSMSWIAADTHSRKLKQMCPCYRRAGFDRKSLAYISERKSIIIPTIASVACEGDRLLRPKSPPKAVPVLAPPPFSLPLLLPSPNLTVTPPKLDFGGEPVDIDKEVTDTFVVRNNGSGILVSFIIPSDDRYTLKIDPLQVAIPKGKDVEFKVRLTVFCTTTIDAQFGMIAADHKTGFMSYRKTLSDSEATFCHSIQFTMTTWLSTQLDYTDLFFEEKIGEGSFASVWKGSWRHTPVAIKLLKNQNPSEASFTEFKREVRVLTQLRHTHIVNFIGAYVSDFGTSRTVSSRGMTSASPALTASSAQQMTALIGTPIYMAPEVLSGANDYGVETDVFSYGIMLWQILTEMLPYRTMKDFYSFVVSGKREEIPETAPPEYAELIVDCWDHDPTRRPPFPAITAVLDHLLGGCVAQLALHHALLAGPRVDAHAGAAVPFVIALQRRRRLAAAACCGPEAHDSSHANNIHPITFTLTFAFTFTFAITFTFTFTITFAVAVTAAAGGDGTTAASFNCPTATSFGFTTATGFTFHTPNVSSSPQPISMYQAVPSAVATPPIEPGFIPAVHPQLEAMTKSSAVMINLAAGEGIFNTLPTRTTIFLSGQQRAHTSSGGVLSVTFTQPFPSTPKVLAWLFGYSNEAPFSAVPTSKILASSTGFTAAVEGNSEMCWIAFATPVTAPALKDAVGFIQASPRGLNKQLVEKVEASIKEGTINAKGNTGLTLLHVASYSGNSELVSYLLDKGAKIDPKDYLGITPLLAAISSGNFDVANLLIEKGAKTLHRAKRGQTALHFLAKSFKADSSSSQLLSTLLVSKIDVNAQTDTGDTALMMACTAPELHLDFISSLIFAEANPCIENNNGESPITKAKASGNIKLIDAISRPTSMCNPQNEKPTQNEQRISLPESLSPPSTVVALELVWSVFQKIGPTASLFQSGRFRASYSRHHIDFVTPYRTLPHVSVWSLSGTQSRIPTKKISPSLKGFDVDLEREGVTVGNSLSWIATDTHIKKPKQLCPCYTQTGLDKKALAYMSERRSIITPLTASPVHEGDQLLRPKSPPKPVPVLAPPRFSLPLLLPSPNLTVTPPKLTFGGSEPCDTDKEVTDTFVVRNNGSGILVSFIIPSDDRYTLKIDPLQVAIPKGKDVEFKARLTVFCTTTIDAQFGMIAADHKTGFMSHRKTLSDSEATFCNSIGLRITTCLSTQIDYTDLIFEESIGQGSFAAVWKGSWRHTPVAIKLLKNQNPTEESFAEFKREIKVLTQLRHTHIVNFIGAVTIPLKLCIITEYMALGNLSSVLIKNQDLAWVIKLKIAKDIALAMSFLHANHIVHRDLKPDNILMVSINKHCDITCKVSDFGTSRAVSSRGMTAASPEITVSALRRMTVLIGTPIYMAPEILSGTQDYGIETDVFSYGVLLWQIVTGYPPYIRLQDFYTFVMSGKREEIPSETPPEYAKLISDCWHQDPAKRPPFLALGKCLEQLVQLQLL